MRDRWGAPSDQPDQLAPSLSGATLRRGDTGWFLTEAPERALGAALAWAVREGLAHLNVIAEEGTGLIQRRADFFSLPVAVWWLEGRSLQPAAAGSESLPAAADGALPVELSRVAPVVERLRQLGLEVVVEHGVVLGEVLGLEVVRIDTDDDGLPRVAVGVGRHDREAKAMLDPLGLAEWEAQLIPTMAEVARRRTAEAPAHPARTLSSERWLRSVLLHRPDLAGVSQLEPIAPPVVRADLRVPCPAPAVGLDGDGTAVTVVCSAGVDAELVPVAAEARAEGTRLVLVIPEGDDLPVTRRLAALLKEPAEVRTVPADWRRLGPPAPRGPIGTL